MLAVDDDRLTGWIAEPHGELGRSSLNQRSLAFRTINHGVLDHLDEVCPETAQRAIHPCGSADDRLRILRGGRRGGEEREGEQREISQDINAAGSATRRPIASAMSHTSI